MPSVEVVIRRTGRTAAWDAVWRWLLEPVPENKETADDAGTIVSGKDAPIAPLTRNDDAP